LSIKKKYAQSIIFLENSDFGLFDFVEKNHLNVQQRNQEQTWAKTRRLRPTTTTTTSMTLASMLLVETTMARLKSRKLTKVRDAISMVNKTKKKKKKKKKKKNVKKKKMPFQLAVHAHNITSTARDEERC
jgi:hypothetical protein